MNLVAAINITNLHKKIGILEKKSSSGGLINFVYDDIDLFEILSIPSLKQSRISENSSYWYVTYKNISVIDAARKKLIHQPIHADFFQILLFFFSSSLRLAQWIDPWRISFPRNETESNLYETGFFFTSEI